MEDELDSSVSRELIGLYHGLCKPIPTIYSETREITTSCDYGTTGFTIRLKWVNQILALIINYYNNYYFPFSDVGALVISVRYLITCTSPFRKCQVGDL